MSYTLAERTGRKKDGDDITSETITRNTMITTYHNPNHNFHNCYHQWQLKSPPLQLAWDWTLDIWCVPRVRANDAISPFQCQVDVRFFYVFFVTLRHRQRFHVPTWKHVKCRKHTSLKQSAGMTPAMVSQIPLRLTGSRPVVGSSRMTTDGLAIIAQPVTCCDQCENLPCFNVMDTLRYITN